MAYAWTEIEEVYASKIDFYEVDCTEKASEKLCQDEYSVNSFPTLAFFPIDEYGSYILHEGGREFDDLVSFAVEG